MKQIKLKAPSAQLLIGFKQKLLAKLGYKKKVASLREEWLAIVGDKNQWRYFEASLTLLLIILLALFALKPTVFAISRLLGQLRARRIVAAKMQAKINQLVTAQGTFFRFQKQRGLLDSYYPEQPSILQGSSQLIGLALKNDLRVKTFSVNQWQLPAKTAVPGKAAFHLIAEGCFTNIESFLSDLFLVRRAVAVERYNLIPVKAEGKEKSLKCGKATLGLQLEGQLGFFFFNSKGRRK